MKVLTRYWITFLSPGSFISNEQIERQSGLIDPMKVVWPDNAYAFRCYERKEITYEEDL